MTFGWSRKVALAALGVLVAVTVDAGALAAQPTITGIQKSDITQSGRIAIEGSGFGTEEGQVLVGGVPAWTSTWKTGRIVAYVPEETPLGPTSLAVVANGQTSNEILFNVVAREADGRIKWTFETDGDNMWWRPALAPDGTIYVHTNNETDGLVYAIAPDGALEWIQKVDWYPYVPPTAGPDGAVYVGSIGTIYRISPEGVIDWEYNPPDGINIEVSPTIGPDGLLYGAFELSGAFAIEPQTGQVVWENPGNPVMTDKSGDATTAVFGPSGPGQPDDRFYLSMDGGAGFYAFSLDGEQLFTSSFGNIKGTTEVAIGSDGTIYGPRSIGLLVAAVEPNAGTTLWEYFPQWAVGTDHVEIGPDDTLYFRSDGGSKIEAFDPDSESPKWKTASEYAYRRPTVTPDGATVIAHGVGGMEEPSFVRALDPEDGSELWTTLLQREYMVEFRVHSVHHPTITPDSATAYLSTLSLVWGVPDDDPYTPLYAIDLSTTLSCEDVQKVQARCKVSGPQVQTRVTLTDTSHDGETVTISVDGVPHVVNVHGAYASYKEATSSGPHTVELTDPAGCFPEKVVICP